jgi:hypothetical protein
MSQPPRGEEPQDPRPASGWGPPSGPPAQGGWGPPSGPPAPGGWGPPGPYGSPYGQYGGPPPREYDSPGQYGSPAGYGQPGQYGEPGRYGHPAGPYGAPTAYGQYGGWGEPQPPRRRPKRHRLLWLLALAALLVVAVVVPTELGSTRLDPRAVQRDVATQFEQREGVAIDLTCDGIFTVQAGATYQCEGTTANGEQVPITITITNADGDYTWSDS